MSSHLFLKWFHTYLAVLYSLQPFNKYDNLQIFCFTNIGTIAGIQQWNETINTSEPILSNAICILIIYLVCILIISFNLKDLAKLDLSN